MPPLLLLLLLLLFATSPASPSPPHLQESAAHTAHHSQAGAHHRTAQEQQRSIADDAAPAMAVRDWAGLSGTLLLDALSFRSTFIAGSLADPPLGAHPAHLPARGSVFLLFTVSELRPILSNSTHVHVHANLFLRSHRTGMMSQSRRRSGFRRSRPRDYGTTQSVPVQGLLSLKTRQFSATLCLTKPSGPEDCNISLSLHYPEARSLLTPAIAGTIASLRQPTDPLYDPPVQFFAKYKGNYAYSKLDSSQIMCAGAPGQALKAAEAYQGSNFCFLFKLVDVAQAVWNSDCKGSQCGPFTGLGGDPSPPARALTFDLMGCNDSTGHLNGFLQLESQAALRESPIAGGTVLAFEGSWFPSSGHLCLVACHLTQNLSDPDCSIHIRIHFPLTLTLEQRFVLVGEAASLRNTSDPRHFKPFSLRSAMHFYNIFEAQNHNTLRYKYTKLDQVDKECAKRTAMDNKTSVGIEIFPGVFNFADLNFHAVFKHQEQSTKGFVELLTVGDSFQTMVVDKNNISLGSSSNKSKFPVSFSIMLNRHKANLPAWHTDISAEGFYAANSGKLCLIGCRIVDIPKKRIKDQQDCEIFVQIQYPSSDPALSTEHPLVGTVSSLRKKSDPLYFEPLEVSARYMSLSEVRKTIWQKDFELLLSMITLSVMVIVVILQLVYSKRHAQTLPYMSLLMLIILTLGYMIPLVLNFEAMFNTRKTLLNLNGGWIEVDEIIIRIMTMALFLLHLRLLQLAWTARNSRLAQESTQVELSEKKILKVCIPIYILGAILACVLQWVFTYRILEAHFLWKAMQIPWWAGLRGYTGFLVDFFLLPQVIANFVWGLREKPLSPVFYGGMTLLRSLPHIYDVFRTYGFAPQYAEDYYFASPESDFFSLAWDIFIPCGGLVLALAIALQQRFGGKCIVPLKWQENRKYEKIPPAAA